MVMESEELWDGLMRLGLNASMNMMAMSSYIDEHAFPCESCVLKPVSTWNLDHPGSKCSLDWAGWWLSHYHISQISEVETGNHDIFAFLTVASTMLTCETG